VILVEVPAISFWGGLHPCTNTKADTLLAYVRYIYAYKANAEAMFTN
jgi:hypothetical protein